MQNTRKQSQAISPVEDQILDQLKHLRNKIEGVEKAIVQMARTEERVIQLMESDREKDKWIRKIQDEVAQISRDMLQAKTQENIERQRRHKIERWIERGVWGFVATAFGLVVAWFKQDKGF